MDITTPHNPDLARAFALEANLAIDWWELGLAFSQEASDAQAQFLLGFYERVADEQLAYIGGEREFDNGKARGQVADLFASLAENIREGGSDEH